jgi:hypothetical protein
MSRTCIPNLRFDDLAILSLDRLSRKLHANGRFGLEVELIPCEPRQEVRLTHPRVTDQDD